MSKEYDDSSIRVLSDREHVRERPLMYVSSANPSYQLFTEILDNAVDEALNGYADCIDIYVNFDTEHPYFTVKDNGRGLPQGINKQTGKKTAEIIYTKLNSGGKYDTESYTVSSGLHGVGASVCNFLSSKFFVNTWRDNNLIHMEFKEGELIKYEESTKGDKTTGTEVICYPDMSHKLISKDPLSNYQKEISDRILLLKTLQSDVEFVYNGNKVEPVSFDHFLTLSKEPLLKDSIIISTKNLIFSVNWSKDTNKSTSKAYCNSLYNPNGGDHEKGIYDAVVESLDLDDALLGINIAVSVKYPGVEYDSQAKLRAVSKDMRKFVKETATSELKSYFRKNSEVKDKVVKLIKDKRYELNKRNNKSSIKRDRKTTFLNSLSVSGFVDCTTKNRSDAELFIVEGRSAAGGLIQSRDTITQAVLPIRGKFINAYTSDIGAVLKNAEVSTLLSSLDTGILQDINIAKSRYGKIIVTTDADEDGKNISCLLLAFFMHCTPELIEQGYLYLALPPLYGTILKDEFIPIYTEEDKDKYLSKGCHVTRYKGLGEMNPTQLRMACMDPTTRTLINITSTKECAEIVANIMGPDSKYRKQLLLDKGVLK